MKLRLHEKLLVCFFVLIGCAFLFYPAVSRWYNSLRFVAETESYEANMGALSDEEIEEEWKKAREYNENLRGDPIHDPFLPGSGMALPENYLECLNVDGIMGYLEIPQINVKLPIYHGTSEETLRKGIGHIESTALPTGDKGGHPVLTGHTGLPEAKLFTDLVKIEEGDKFYLDILGEVFCYQVDQIEVILPEKINELAAYKGHDYVTLLTCTPYGVNSHRLLVRGERIPYVQEEKKSEEEMFSRKRMRMIGAVSLLVILIAGIYLCHRYKKKKRQRNRDV